MTICHRRPALTLLEVIISVSLMVLLAGAMFGFYNLSLSSRERGCTVLDDGNLAWQVLSEIAEDIRGANGFLAGIGPGIRGLRQEITLQTVVLPDKELLLPRSIREKPLPGQCDVREVRYYLGIDPEETESYPDPESQEGSTSGPKILGIVRRELRTFRQTAPQVGRIEDYDVDLLEERIRYLRFRYFDGVEWVDLWQPPEGGMGNALPQAVEITVGFDAVSPQDPTKLDFEETEAQVSQPEQPNPQRYSLVVRLNQADTFFGSRLMRASKRALSGGFESGKGGTGSSLGSADFGGGP